LREMIRLALDVGGKNRLPDCQFRMAREKEMRIIFLD
jgi:hypothetical protein